MEKFWEMDKKNKVMETENILKKSWNSLQHITTPAREVKIIPYNAFLIIGRLSVYVLDSKS